MPPEILIITGPTGVGKTEVAVELAMRLGTEIISADSMQVYTHLSIGTAKPSAQELRGIPYHLIDHVAPGTQYNVGRFLREAEPIIARLRAEEKLPILCGGTGLYLRALLHGVFEGGGADEEIRAQLEERATREGLAPLYKELISIDPAPKHIMPNDRQRVLRALEVYYSTGKPITTLQTQSVAAPRFRAKTFILERPRVELYERINARVHQMLQHGLLDEVRHYLSAGLTRDNPALNALGYAEMIFHLGGSLTIEEATTAMQQKSRNYAKRQMTWFRSMKDASVVPISDKSATRAAEEIHAAID
ncbi:MAG: tRNA (adenosine(37)-N6)-dimethylallyltransferase MiaA [Candidatus Sumerlaeaceae bacterium]